MARFGYTAKSARSEDEKPKLEALLARTRKPVPREAVSSTRALRAVVLRRAISMAKSAMCSSPCVLADTAGSKAQCKAAASPLAQAIPCTPRVVCKPEMAVRSAQEPRPNLSLNRSANGVPPCPRGCACLSSASRASRHTAVARLALR
jgi:hypothetical protein